MRLKDKYALALQRRGEQLVPDARAVRYSVMTRAEGGFYFLGRAGALRFGRTIRGSVPARDGFKQSLLVSLAESE